MLVAFDRINSQRNPIPTTSEGERLSLSDGVFAFFLRPDADGILNRTDENFAVANFPGAGGLDNGFDGVVHQALHDDDFDFDFGKKIDRVFTAAVNLRVALLASETFHFADRHALDAKASQ